MPTTRFQSNSLRYLSTKELLIIYFYWTLDHSNAEKHSEIKRKLDVDLNYHHRFDQSLNGSSYFLKILGLYCFKKECF